LDPRLRVIMRPELDLGRLSVEALADYDMVVLAHKIVQVDLTF